MSQTVADFLLSRMREWGVERVFGYPGDGINGIKGDSDRWDVVKEGVKLKAQEFLPGTRD